MAAGDGVDLPGDYGFLVRFEPISAATSSAIVVSFFLREKEWLQACNTGAAQMCTDGTVVFKMQRCTPYRKPRKLGVHQSTVMFVNFLC
jgi:hypothetical protein